MKKRQKIIVVISCLSVIFSVLAVNCFALPGSDFNSDSYLDYTGLNGAEIEWSQDMLYSIENDYGARLFDYTNVANHPYYDQGTEDTSYDITYGMQTVTAEDDATYDVNVISIYKKINDEKYKFQLDWRARKPALANGVRRNGETIVATPLANAVTFSYGSFALADIYKTGSARYKQDELTASAQNATYGLDDVAITGHLVGDVVLSYVSEYEHGVGSSTPGVVETSSYTYVEPITITFTGYMPYGSNIKPFAHECTGGVTYSAEYFDAEDEEYHTYSERFEDEVIGESIGTFINNCYRVSAGGDYRDGYLSVQHTVNTVRDAKVRVQTKFQTGGITSVAMNNYCVGYPSIEYAPIENDVTIENIIEEIVVEEVQVEPFEWIMQVADGVLEIELFGEITIGHLLMIAIAVPCLLAILRAIAGG